MMNPRIVELLSNPKLLAQTDLNLLQSEIASKPYMQSLRAVYLLGIHQFQPENYNQILSETAAFTTDKKILYQFINGKDQVEFSEPIQKIEETQNVEETVEIDESLSAKDEIPPIKTEEQISEKSLEIVEELRNTENMPISYEEIQPIELETPKEVFVEGVLNRILFEGEENFLEEETQKIDLEQTQESGKIVVERKIDVPVSETQIEIPQNKEIEKVEILNNESVVETKEIVEETIESEEENDINFHQTSHFLPEVKIESKLEEKTFSEPPKPVINKYEEEMQKLIAEVEKKMKEKKSEQKVEIKKEEIVEEKTENSNEVSFAETQDFEVKEKDEVTEKVEEETENNELEKNSEPTPKIESEIEIVEEKVEEKIQEETKIESNWKPLNFQQNQPDSFIQTQQKPISVKEEISTEQQKVEEKIIKEKPLETPKSEEEIPVMNVSFFSDQIEKTQNKEEKPTEISEEKEESNVPKFINTWQSWLKIERKETKSEEASEEIQEIAEEKTEEIVENPEEKKSKAIETFIENEPKISKLKEEVDFVVKDKGDDISHLMTETLANIYAEQKLYAKAIKAFELLKKKHPEKKEHFDNRIKEIKEQRSN